MHQKYCNNSEIKPNNFGPRRILFSDTMLTLPILVLYIIYFHCRIIPKFCMMTAFPPDARDGSTVPGPAAPDHDVHVVLLPVRRFLLHTTPETEHRCDYSDDSIFMINIWLFGVLVFRTLYSHLWIREFVSRTPRKATVWTTVDEQI